MVDLEPLLDGPFEQASNRSFELVLAVGVVLLAAVAAVGRSPITTLVVGLYLLAIPVYVAVRIWVWESPVIPDPEADGENGADDSEPESGNSTE